MLEIILTAVYLLIGIGAQKVEKCAASTHYNKGVAIIILFFWPLFFIIAALIYPERK